MATLYFINGGVNNNWGTAGNWSSSSGGPHVAEAVPTSADDVRIDANSPACIIDTTARVCKTLLFTGYTNTITMTNALTVSGSVTLVSAMTIAGAAGLTIDATATITSNGKTWPNALTLTGQTTSKTISLAGTFTVNGLVTLNGNSRVNLNTNVLICNAGFTSTVPIAAGSGTISMNGTGTFNNSVTTDFRTAIIFNTAGTVTISAAMYSNSNTITYISGTIVTTGSTLTFFDTTFYTSGMTWNNMTADPVGTLIVLGEHLNVSGTLTLNQFSYFDGLHGFTVANLVGTTAAAEVYLQNSGIMSPGETYRVTNSLLLAGTIATPMIFLSDSGSVNAQFSLDFGATQDVSYITATRVDSSAGQTIWDYKGTLSNTINWQLLTPPGTVASVFVN